MGGQLAGRGRMEVAAGCEVALPRPPGAQRARAVPLLFPGKAEQVSGLGEASPKCGNYR